MKLSELIDALQKCIEENGDGEVCGMVNGHIMPQIEINAEEMGNGPITYIELYN